MTKDDFEDAKSLWKFSYAHDCFRQAASACSHILDSNLETEHPLYYPLLTSVYILYGKPFKRAKVVGKLSDKIIPSEQKTLHETLLDHRDKFYAHTDAKSLKLSDFGETNQVRFLVLSHEIRLFATQFRTRPPFLPEVIELCHALQTKVNYHIAKLQKRHAKKIPQAVGEYAINILDESGPFVIKERPLILRPY
jgi:hypothetical protein